MGSELGKLIGLGMLSVSGLLVVLARQQWKLGDGLAFLKAPVAWITPPPWPQRVPAFLTAAGYSVT